VTVRANYAGCPSLTTSGSTEARLNNYLNASCFVAVPNLPAGTALTGLSPQQGPASGTFPVGSNGVTGDSGVGSLFGVAGRNLVQGPAEQRFDLALTKVFPVHKLLGEAGNLTFRAEAFKVFNNPIFSNPAANISVSTFGRITSTLDSTGRILQLALKLNF